MNTVQIIDFKHTTCEPLTSVMEPARQIVGSPEQTLQNIYKNQSGELLSGSWSSDVGKWHIDYSNRHEFCYLTEGHIVLADESGTKTELKAGDAFVIPMGFKGTWEVIKPVKKHYVILMGHQ